MDNGKMLLLYSRVYPVLASQSGIFDAQKTSVATREDTHITLYSIVN